MIPACPQQDLIIIPVLSITEILLIMYCVNTVWSHYAHSLSCAFAGTCALVLAGIYMEFVTDTHGVLCMAL
jgi:uncharacterized membrane protein